MQARAFGGRDDIACRTRTLRLGNLDVGICAECSRDAIHRDAGFRRHPLLEVPARDRDVQALRATIERRCCGFDGTVDADRILGIGALHRIVGERQIQRRACERPEMVEARDEWERTCAR